MLSDSAWLLPGLCCIQDDDFESSGKSIDASGAGTSSVSPGWLTQLNLLWSGKGNIPVADAQPDDIKELLGGALFKALYKWMVESGPVYLLPTGPVSSFLVISDPECAKHVLRSTDNPSRNIYGKGLVAEVSKFLFGEGFAISGGEQWRARRRAVGPSLHRCAEGLCPSLPRSGAPYCVVYFQIGLSIELKACPAQPPFRSIKLPARAQGWANLFPAIPIPAAACLVSVRLKPYMTCL